MISGEKQLVNSSLALRSSRSRRISVRVAFTNTLSAAEEEEEEFVFLLSYECRNVRPFIPAGSQGTDLMTLWTRSRLCPVAHGHQLTNAVCEIIMNEMCTIYNLAEDVLIAVTRRSAVARLQ